MSLDTIVSILLTPVTAWWSCRKSSRDAEAATAPIRRGISVLGRAWSTGNTDIKFNPAGDPIGLNVKGQAHTSIVFALTAEATIVRAPAYIYDRQHEQPGIA
jgi:hypothetical protein